MTPVTRTNVSLDDFTIEVIGLLSELLGASKSEVIRRGVDAYLLSMEPMLMLMVDGARKERLQTLTKAARGGKEKRASVKRKAQSS